MSIKEIKEATEQKKVTYGIKQAIKNKKKNKNVYITKDTRNETVQQLEEQEIEFSVMKTKKELAKELNLDFETEVIAVY